MRVLLDTHVALGLLQKGFAANHPSIALHLANPGTAGLVSVASIWEIAIKSRLGKLDPKIPLADIAPYLEAVGVAILPIATRHVIASVEPEPATRDPFDRLLLAQCKVEGLLLATLDRALRGHPMALQL